jgi:hypothetical protein
MKRWISVTVNKIFVNILFLLLLVSSLVACTSNENISFLKEVKGTGFTYSQYFKSVDDLDDRKNGSFYQPLSFEEVTKIIPDSMKDSVNLINTNDLPFNVSGEIAYLVKSKDEGGNVQHQVQFTYLNNDSYGNSNEFVIISITEAKENPLTKYDFSDEKYDTVGNELREEIIKDGIPMYNQIITSNSALTYKYYDYNEEENLVTIVATAANELYGYYKGHIYHVGYLIDGNKNNEEVQGQMLQLTRDFILGR